MWTTAATNAEQRSCARCLAGADPDACIRARPVVIRSPRRRGRAAWAELAASQAAAHAPRGPRRRAAEQRDELAAFYVEHRGLPPLCAISEPPTGRCPVFGSFSLPQI